MSGCRAPANQIMPKSILVSLWRVILPSCFSAQRILLTICNQMRAWYCAVCCVLCCRGTMVFLQWILILSLYCLCLAPDVTFAAEDTRMISGRYEKKDNSHLSQSLTKKKRGKKGLSFPLSPLADLFVTRCYFWDQPGTSWNSACTFLFFTSRHPGCKSASFVVQTVQQSDTCEVI